MNGASQQPAPARRQPPPGLEEFRHVREEKLRLTDLDFQKHVNNAAFTAFLANARFDFFETEVRPHLPVGAKLVIARLEVDFRGEMLYGDPVLTGTRRKAVGRTSMGIEQCMYQGGRCVAQALSVFVHVADGEQSPSVWPAVFLEQL